MNKLRVLFLARELANHASAIRQRIEYGIAPTGREDWGHFLVYMFVGLSEKSRVLTRWRRGKFTHGNQKLGITGSVAFFESKSLK